MATAGLQFPAASQQNSSSVLPTTDGTPQHKRTYQACIPCRRRKVRCDLGSVDNPHDPPCVRCRRESKECYFSATRRKRKTAEGDGSGDGEYEDDFEVRNSRKRLRSRSETPPIAIYRQQNSVHTDIKPGSSNYSPLATSFPKPPLTPGGSFGRAQPLRRPRSETQDGSDSKSPQAQYTSRVPRQNPYPATVRSSSTATSAEGLEEDAHLTNSTAAALLRTEVYNGHDALNLLFEAAGRTGDIARRHNDGHGGSQQSSMPGIGSLGSRGRRSSEGLTNGSAENDSAHPMAPPRSIPGNPPIDPAMTNGTAAILNTDEAKLQPALKAWSRFRFIRAGWFTAREAILYIDYFYTYLAPLTPISPPNFHAPSTHATLLIEEPILTVTLLTVSSRYMKLPGAGGLSRSYSIHEKLWTYLRGMIERMVWGQEQFGGSLRPETIEDDGDTQTSSTAPWRGARKGNLRTLGTVESLMLLTEWHPRALHFPPGDDGDELLVREDLAGSNSSDLDAEDGKSKGIGGKRLESYLEPAWRSDRMCWMLLGNAMALSFELGVFDDVDDTSPHGGELHRPEYGQEAYRVRAKRVQKLLVIFVTQLAGRLEWNSNMVPPHISNSAFPKIPSPQQEHASIRKQINGESLRDAPKQNIFATPKYSLPVDNVHQCWLAIANLMKRGNELIFRNKNHTRDIIRSGRYVSLLNYFQPLLREWRQNFDSLDIPTHIRHILSIEADYVRMYINSLALQAVVERLSNNANNENLHSTLSTASMSPTSRSMPGNIPPSTLMSLYGGDQEFVKEVVEASRSLLSTVVEGLLPNEYLKHCPIRTYFRIISGAMFLLKTFALGANEDEVAISLGLMDSTVNGLRNCVVDDVHMGIRFADLLDTLTSRIRARFVRMAATGNNGTARAESKSPAPQNPRRSSNHPPQFPEQQQVYTPQWTPGGYEQPAYINAPDGRSTPNPLFGISTESIDPSGGNVSIMPPPSFGFPQGFEGGAPAIQHTDRTFVPSLTEDTNGQYMPDWLALPLDPLLQYGAGVSQTEVGPDVGGYDLLEILLSEMEEGASGV